MLFIDVSANFLLVCNSLWMVEAILSAGSQPKSVGLV